MNNFYSIIVILVLLFGHQYSTAQKVIFDNQSALQVEKGDTLYIKKPAVILDTLNFNKIRLNLENYKQLKNDYQKNIEINKKLVNQLSATQDRLDKILKSNDLQKEEINKLRTLVNEINTLSGEMEVVNNDFDVNNEAFNNNLEAMNENNKRLNKEISRLRIRNIKSHIITALLGATIGVVIASTL